MEADIKNNYYIDHGEFGGHLYGTHLSSIRDVIYSGRSCILDVSARVSLFALIEILGAWNFIFVKQKARVGQRA